MSARTSLLAVFKRLRRLVFGGTAPKKTALLEVLERLKQKNIGVGSLLNLGAGAGDDQGAFLEVWPGMASLHIDMDRRYEPAYRRLQSKYPGTHYEICAVGPLDGSGSFAKSDAVGGVLTLNAPAATASNAHNAPVAKLDTLVAKHGLKGPFFIKFDTHGVELDILAGAEATLRQTSLIMMEVYNFKLNFVQQKNLTFDEMSLHMKTLGFRCVDLCDPLFRPGDGALWQMHMFFIRADHPTWGRSSYSTGGAKG